MDDFGLNSRQQPIPRPKPSLAPLLTSYLFLSLSISLTGIVLAAWFVPEIASLLPDQWSQMKANTALSLMIAGLGLGLTLGNKVRHSPLLTLIAGIMAIFASISLAGHITGDRYYIETLLALDSHSLSPGRVSILSSLFLLSVAGYLASRYTQTQWGTIAKRATFTAIIMLAAFSAIVKLFEASEIYMHDADTLTSAQTIIVMVLLAATIWLKETRDGILKWLSEPLPGTQSFKTVLPLAIILPISTIAVSNYLIGEHIIPAGIGHTLEAMLLVAFFVLALLKLADRINHSERELSRLALTDELTGLHNRRAFYTIGGHLFEEARRNQKPLTVVFFDLDGLKVVNDNLGHEVGSELIAEFAALLQDTFRSSDVVARVGGDEFAILSHTDLLTDASCRLAERTEKANSQSGAAYRMSYSQGQVIADARFYDSFDAIVEKADMLMFDQKRKKSQKRHKAIAADKSKQSHRHAPEQVSEHSVRAKRSNNCSANA